MHIIIQISKDELEELELDNLDLQGYIIDTLDDLGNLLLPAYNVEIQVK